MRALEGGHRPFGAVLWTFPQGSLIVIAPSPGSIVFQLLKPEALHGPCSRKKEGRGGEKEHMREQWTSQVSGTSTVEYRPHSAPGN